MAETWQSLRSLFGSAEDRQKKLEAGLGGGGEGAQEELRLAIRKYEQCRRAVEELALFSPNETAEDISSGDLQYLLIEHHLAELILRRNDVDRRTTLRRARESHERFLRLLDRYELLSNDDRRLYERYLEAPDSFSTASTTDPAARRQTKIARYKQEKELKEKLEFYRRRSEASDVDDAEVRALNLARIRFAVHQSFASLESIALELDVLSLAPPEPAAEPETTVEDHRRRNGSGADGYSERVDPPTSRLLATSRGGPLLSKDGKPMQPFTLLDSRERIRQGVFRPGHNLPTMTIDEYLEEEKRRGGIIDGGGAESGRPAEPDEDNMERADQETMKAREWDEFKEANPRGSGNTLNRG